MKKRILAWVLALVMIVGLLPTVAFAADLSGSGTEDDPYLIATADDLVTFRDLVNGAGAGKTSTLYAKLTDNIDLSGQTNWTPIGKAFGGPYSSPVKYAGTFDGNGHKVTNLTINSDQKVSGSVWLCQRRHDQKPDSQRQRYGNGILVSLCSGHCCLRFVGYDGQLYE